MTAGRPNSNLPGALAVFRPLVAAWRRLRPPGTHPATGRLQGDSGGPQESQQNGSVVLRSGPARCPRCGGSLAGGLVKAAVDGIVHLSCPTPRQLEHARRMGRRDA